jgi:bifunctional non-homologous end joining protein LigD
MISKRLDAPYRSGRTKDWLKTKCVESQEFVVVGFVPSTTARRAIGSLVMGFYEKDQLIHAGRVGTGFAQTEAETLFAALESIKIDGPSFGRKMAKDAEKGVRWVEPRLVVEVEHRGWSSDELLRHASFRGLREDKDAREIVREGQKATATKGPVKTSPISHPERMLWPSDGITKQGLADFYADSARWILPHLVNRPLSLVRCPGGIAADCFYAKNEWAGLGKAVRRVASDSSETLLVVDDIEGLMALVQGNVLEIHPWGSTTKDLERPDRLIFDLDPGDGASRPAVRIVRLCDRRQAQ